MFARPHALAARVAAALALLAGLPGPAPADLYLVTAEGSFAQTSSPNGLPIPPAADALAGGRFRATFVYNEAAPLMDGSPTSANASYGLGPGGLAVTLFDAAGRVAVSAAVTGPTVNVGNNVRAIVLNPNAPPRFLFYTLDSLRFNGFAQEPLAGTTTTFFDLRLLDPTATAFDTAALPAASAAFDLSRYPSTYSVGPVQVLGRSLVVTLGNEDGLATGQVTYRLDSLTVTAVPVPAGVGLLLAGLPGVGLVARLGRRLA